MKKILIFLFFLLFTFLQLTDTYSQWRWMHPTPQGNTLRYVKMFSPSNIVAVGLAGTFMKTSNAGLNWTIYNNAGGMQAWGQGKALYSGWFFDMNTGLVCGSSGWIGRTTNGGMSWDSIPGGGTATLYGIHFINANTGFIGGTSGTVLKSTNAGATWTAIPTGGTLSIYNIFAYDVNHIYAPTSSTGVLLYTTNGGTNWLSASTTGVTLYDAAFVNANTGFVAGSSGHIKLTTDGGTTWSSINIPSVTSTFYELRASQTTGAPTYYTQNFDAATFPPTGWRAVNVAGPQEWVRSTSQSHSAPASAFINYDCSGLSEDWLITHQIAVNSGDSISFWLRTHDVGFPPDSLAVRVSTTDTALSSFTTRIMYLAEGAGYPGNTWTKFGTSLNAFAGQNIYIAFKHVDNCGDGIYIDDVVIGGGASSVTTLYVVGDAFNIYRTTNLGVNWTAIPHLDPAQIWTSTFYSMDINGSSMIAAAASGLWTYSSNSGTNWTTNHKWILAGTFYDVWAEYNNGKVLAVGSGSNNTKILYSSNGGALWIPRDIPTTKYFRDINMVNANTGYVGGSSGLIMKTTNGGANWDSLPFPSTNLVYALDFPTVTTGWAVSSSTPYIWKTTDAGMTWNVQTGPASALYNIDMFDANTGWVVGTSALLQKTTDGGATWTAQTPNTTATLYGITTLSANHVFIAGASGTVRKTTNGGTTWDSVLTPYSTTIYGMDWVDLDNGIIVASSVGYTAKTVNGGLAWTIQNTSGSTMYNVHMNSPDSAWSVGSIQGIFKWANSPLGITWTPEVPTKFFLGQNYPNPFNPMTTIKFGVPSRGNVSLNVYDITGRLVSQLLNNAPLNPGVVEVKFDGNNLSSGVYFYTLTVDNKQIDTKKMVLVK